MFLKNKTMVSQARGTAAPGRCPEADTAVRAWDGARALLIDWHPKWNSKAKPCSTSSAKPALT